MVGVLHLMVPQPPPIFTTYGIHTHASMLHSFTYTHIDTDTDTNTHTQTHIHVHTYTYTVHIDMITAHIHKDYRVTWYTTLEEMVRYDHLYHDSNRQRQH